MFKNIFKKRKRILEKSHSDNIISYLTKYTRDNLRFYIKDGFGKDIYEGDIIIGNNNEDDETSLHLIEFGNEDMENSSFYSGFKVSDYRNLDIFWNDT